MKMAQRFLTILLTLSMLAASAAPAKKNAKKPAAKKNDKKASKPAAVGPFVSIEISSRIMSAVDAYDKVMASLKKDFDKMKKKNWNDKSLKGDKDKLQKLKDKLDSTLDRENKSIDSKANGLEKDLERLSKKLDNATEATEASIQKQMEEKEKILNNIDRVREAFNVFSRYCYVPKKSPTETDLKGTALEYRGKNMPKIGKGEGYHGIIFCASNNRGSISALSAMSTLGLDSYTAVICDTDDAVYKKNFESKKLKYEVIRDANFALAHRHKVMLLPTIYVGNAAGKCIYAMVGMSSKQKSIIKYAIRDDKKAAKKK